MNYHDHILKTTRTIYEFAYGNDHKIHEIKYEYAAPLHRNHLTVYYERFYDAGRIIQDSWSPDTYSDYINSWFNNKDWPNKNLPQLTIPELDIAFQEFKGYNSKYDWNNKMTKEAIRLLKRK